MSALSLRVVGICLGRLALGLEAFSGSAVPKRRVNGDWPYFLEGSCDVRGEGYGSSLGPAVWSIAPLSAKGSALSRSAESGPLAALDLCATSDVARCWLSAPPVTNALLLPFSSLTPSLNMMRAIVIYDALLS